MVAEDLNTGPNNSGFYRILRVANPGDETGGNPRILKGGGRQGHEKAGS